MLLYICQQNEIKVVYVKQKFVPLQRHRSKTSKWYELTNAEIVPFVYNTIPSYAIKREILESSGTLIPTKMGRPILR